MFLQHLVKPLRNTNNFYLSTSTANKARLFSSTSAVMVKAGDTIPEVTLVEDSPGNIVELHKEIGTGNALIIGVPAAFSPSCSNSHVPGYINHPKLKDAGKVFVVSVNDPFVMKAWSESLDTNKSSRIRFLADPSGAFTRALDTEFDSAKVFGQNRSKRYAITIESGRVKDVYIEPDNTGVSVSTAEKVLG
ncbi:hypothetical protein EPUS_05315 [Endocarpon pusillum Z07020]|uniref:Redoxin domain-containing protein n=1 Tax=Endocarpon pusillum (strain Z07020 / HMAS-L-300199) TaxID=1263415 RepID=U1GGN0_ENDPU|nr:uncharacterized protein EPUS_05315 [Endocarpon pusillum Z07020]ERF71263.1 hypothetical protein EPUS_05315 [Endocarpon pusillum Z07020]